MSKCACYDLPRTGLTLNVVKANIKVSEGLFNAHAVYEKHVLYLAYNYIKHNLIMWNI